jgi:hypothetical protein
MMQDRSAYQLNALLDFVHILITAVELPVHWCRVVSGDVGALRWKLQYEYENSQLEQFRLTRCLSHSRKTLLSR